MTATWNPDFKPEAALNYFKRKGLKASFSWQDMWHEEHDAAFTIAKMMDVDLLRDMKDAVDKAQGDVNFPKDLPAEPNIFEMNGFDSS